MSADAIRPGFYKDKYGRLQPDRRAGDDRRATSKVYSHDHDRRKLYRRMMDRELLEKDHLVMIEEALEDFAEEHGGHV